MRYVAKCPSVIAAPAFLFSGIALLSHVYFGFNLRNSLVAVSLSASALVSALWLSLSNDDRRGLIRLAYVGAISGLVATGIYDVVRYLLVRASNLTVNPFEAFKSFGSSLLAGSGFAASPWIVGSAFHILNGTCFGIAYTLAWGRSGARGGLLWALMLELLMMNVYPRWLGLDLSSEFMAVSIVGHAAYGMVLGSLAKRSIRPEEG
jgi:hypothetical protein